MNAGDFEQGLDRLMSAGKEEVERAFRGFQATRVATN